MKHFEPALPRRRFLSGACGTAALMLAGGVPSLAAALFAPEARAAGREMSSEEVSRAFERFADTRRMDPELGAWLGDRAIQEIDPYRAFDNVWNVGIRWVSAWAIRTSEGVILIDTLHEPFAERLLANLAAVGVGREEIRYVLMTHGHFDHVGGYERLLKVLPNARFGMSERGWAEAKHHAGEGRFRIPRIDMVLRDGDPVTLGQTTVTVLETPGHTWGTCSYMYPVFLAGERHTGVTIGGQGLNAMDDPKQLAAYIASMKRLGSDELGIDVDLTAHPFSTGLTELIPAVRSWKPGSAHPLVSRPEYLGRLDRLIRRAEGYVKR